MKQTRKHLILIFSFFILNLSHQSEMPPFNGLRSKSKSLIQILVVDKQGLQFLKGYMERINVEKVFKVVKKISLINWTFILYFGLV